MVSKFNSSKKIGFFLLMSAFGQALDSVSRARNLEAPPATATAGGEAEGAEFWDRHGPLLRDAWDEWAAAADLPPLSERTVIDPSLREAVSAAWDRPSALREEHVRSLVPEAVPGVHRCRLFAPESIRALRAHLEATAASGIPRRRPNGMNRHGVILGDETDGAVSYRILLEFRNLLADRYLRPIGRALFPEHVGDGDDAEIYAFTISYTPGGDVELKEHRDMSVVTLNVNLNLPGEDYSGSSLYFIDETGRRQEVQFEPGMALFHLGSHRHAALPIIESERHNLVLWLFGAGGYVRVAPYHKNEQLSLRKRWYVMKKWLTTADL